MLFREKKDRRGGELAVASPCKERCCVQTKNAILALKRPSFFILKQGLALWPSNPRPIFLSPTNFHARETPQLLIFPRPGALVVPEPKPQLLRRSNSISLRNGS